MLVSEVENQVEKEQKSEPSVLQMDARFRNEKFKEAVRFTLQFLGLESNLENFIKYDGLIDFLSFFQSKILPKKIAVFYILDRKGDKIPLSEKGGSYATLGVEFDDPGASCEVEKMEKHGFLFKRWF
jgi:hypothetical protein